MIHSLGSPFSSSVLIFVFCWNFFIPDDLALGQSPTPPLILVVFLVPARVLLRAFLVTFTLCVLGSSCDWAHSLRSFSSLSWLNLPAQQTKDILSESSSFIVPPLFLSPPTLYKCRSGGEKLSLSLSYVLDLIMNC